MSAEQRTGSIWYISKYLALPSETRHEGGRGYELMRELATDGNQVTIFVSDSNHLADVPELRGTHLVEHDDKLSVCWIRTLKFTNATSRRRILSWLHFEWRLLRLNRQQFGRPDVIVASSLSILSVLTGVYFRWRYKCRLVFEVRDIWPLTLTEEGGYSSRNPMVMFLAWVEHFGYRRADTIVGTMPNLSAHVEHVLGYARRTECIPMGFAQSSLAQPRSLPSDYIQKFIPNDRFVVGYAGTIGITNALEPFFAAASILASEPIEFVLVGDGDLREQYVAKYGHLNNVTFADKVPKQCVQAVLAEFDVLYFAAHPSRVWEYGQSLNKVIDYMLSGKPIIASFSGYPSMINEANCGTFLPPGDSLALAEEIERLAALEKSVLVAQGARGRSWIIEQRNYAQLAREYAEILFPDPDKSDAG